MEKTVIELKSIKKSFNEKIILDTLNLSVSENEFLTLLGPSGCGKTTILRLIGGFETPDSGKIYFEGKDITDKAPYEREINTVFQKYALFPHLNVFDNIAFSLRIKKIDEKIIKEKVINSLKLVNLEGMQFREIKSLSGGEQQRIAIARALINEPKVLLLDEPLAALDLKLRKGMQYELKKIQKQTGVTFIYVTHDQEEALTMSDQIIIMNKGIIQQKGVPTDIYNEPKNAFVANFIGDSNIVKGVMHEDYFVEFLNHKFKCVDKGFKKDERVDIVIRPEDVELTKECGMLNGIIKAELFKGIYYDMEVDVQGTILTAQSTVKRDVGSRVGINIEPDLIHVMRES